MKSVLLVYENAAGEPAKELDGRTPLQVARCAAATRLASEGRCGALGKPPAGETARVEATLAALCGVPRTDAWRLARGPLEAESAGVDWSAYNYAYRGDFITLDNGVIRDSWLAKLSLQEAERLTQAVQESFDPAKVRLVTLGPAHVVVLVRAEDTKLNPGQAPWAVEGDAEISAPEGRHGKLPREIMAVASEVLSRQTINDVRVDLGENPATSLWLWGGGPRTELPEKFGGRPLKAVMLTQSPMATGLARLLGASVEPLQDPWSAQGTAVLERARMTGLLKEYDLVIVYVRATPELVRGPTADKVRLLERADLLLTAPLFDGVKKVKHRRVVLTAVETMTGEAERARPVPQPAVLWGAHVAPDGAARWDEPSCSGGELGAVEPGQLFELMTGD